MKNIAIFLFALLFATPAFASNNTNQTYVLNTKTNVYHAEGCYHAKRCTKNCTKVDFKKVQEAKAKKCKACANKMNINNK